MIKILVMNLIKKISSVKTSNVKKESRTRKNKTGAEGNQKEGEIGDQKGQDTVL